MAEGVFPKVDGDILYASEVNELYTREINQVYTSTGFDSSQIGSSGTDEQSVELTAITAAQLVGKRYVKIRILHTHYNFGSGNSACQLKIQVKETGGAYGDDLAYKDLSDRSTVTTKDSLGTIEWTHTLTAGEITNGVQFKIFSKSTNDNVNASNGARVTNIQTVVELE